jgi:hypothetical protein
MKREQRKRVKGYKQPENCLYCGRPTKWGNPFRLTPDGWIQCYSINRNILDPWILWSMCGGFKIEDIIELYEYWITNELKTAGYGYLPTPPDINELRKYDYLSCFCPLDQPCHCDVLIRLLNDND